MTKQNQKKCIFCRKEGFPILPVRYSLAPYVDCDHLIKAGKNCTPDIKTAGNFEVDGPAIGNTKANYTLRLLRAGFLYLYNEKTKTLSLYYVSGGSDEGYLKGTYYVQIREFSQNDSEEETESKCQPTPGITALDGAVCEGACTQARASYITVPKDSAVIWLTFSDAMWPKEIVKACLNNEASFNGAKKSFREEYMRKFDVKAWKESQDALHTATIDKLGEVVTEYYRDAVSNLSTIWLGTEMATPAKTDRNDWPTFTERFNCQVCKKEPRANTFLKYVPYNTLVYDSKKLDDMLAEAKKLSVDAPGAIVALDDPVGVLLYLSNLMSWLVAKCASGRWTSMLPADTDFGWKQFTATSLDGLKSKVITDAYINRALELYFDREIEKLKQSPPSTLEVMTAVDDLGRIINQKVMDDWSAKQKKIRQLKQERNDISSGKTPFDRKEMADKIGLSEEQLDNICIDVAEKTWKDYSKYLDESEVDGFKKDFQRVMSNFKKTVVEKFGRLYVDWLTSDFLYRYFNGNYSQIETEKSGSAMSLIFYNCISTISENSSACLDQIELWHEKDPDGEEPSRNLLLRAYLNNNKELISDFSGFGVVVDERNDSEDEEVSSSKLGKEYDNKIDVAAQKFLDGLVKKKVKWMELGAQKAGAALMKVMKKNPLRALKFMGMISGTNRVLQVNANPDDIMKWCRNYLKYDSSTRISINGIKASQKNGGIKRAPRHRPARVPVYTLVHTGGINDNGQFYSKLSTGQRLSAADLFDKNENEIKNIGSSLSKMGLGAVSCYLTVYSISSAYDKLKSGGMTESETAIAFILLFNSATSLASKAASTISKCLSLWNLHRVGLLLKYPMLETMSKVLARPGAWIFVVVDAFSAYDSFDDGNYRLTILYLGAAALGIAGIMAAAGAAMVAAGTAATATGLAAACVFLAPWVVPILILSVAVYAVIAAFQPPAAKKWLTNCYFAQNDYWSVNSEMKALGNAMGVSYA